MINLVVMWILVLVPNLQPGLSGAHFLRMSKFLISLQALAKNSGNGGRIKLPQFLNKP